jgi:hypothetical protein
MGNRANVYVRESAEEPGVYLYTHWDGDNLPFMVQRALKKHWRWDDVSYLTRIIFCQIVKDTDDLEGELNLGISTQIPDNEHLIIVVDCKSQTVRFVERDGLDGRLPPGSYPNFTWTFGAYIGLSEDAITAAYGD